jgi:anionic cell wall polymer biosynthesis LytR-Cps2A-Psr (LCP) family protein
MAGMPGGTALAGKVGYGLACALSAVVLMASGAAHFAQQATDSIGSSKVLANGKSVGEMNILIMGLESRTYWDGTPIDHHLQYTLHVGSQGGQATNTLILLHIFAGGHKAVGFSIPRDDYVQMVGTNGGPKMNKIDAAYNSGMQARMTADRRAHPGWSARQVTLDGNEGGRLAAVETVQALTGVHIDKFAELNLVGFYELAKAFGGVYVCVKPWPGGYSSSGYVPKNGNLRDPVVYSPRTGWQGSGSVVRPGTQHLTPEQALAFVRNRHNIPGGDTGRTARQQAVLDYVLWKLKTAGALADVGKLSALMGVAKNFLAVPAGWNLLEFAGEMNALTGHNLTMSTLPSTPGPNIPSIGSVNNVDVAKIQSIITRAFAAPPGADVSPDGPVNGATGQAAAGQAAAGQGAAGQGAAGQGAAGQGAAGQGAGGSTAKPAATRAAAVPPRSSVTVDVDNASGHTGLARNVLDGLVAAGYKRGTAQTVTPEQSLTTVSYGPGAQANAAVIARYFGAATSVTASGSLPAGRVLVTMGVATLQVPVTLGGPRPAPAATVPSQAASSSGGAQGGGAQGGGTVTVEPNAQYGAPCVY